MESNTPHAPVSKGALWTSYVFSAVPVFMLLMSGVMKIIPAQAVAEGFPQMGYPLWLARPIGVVELICTVVYLVPKTSVLGAILLTGYLGGATATHVRMEDPNFYGAIIFGVLLWGGLYLRDRRVRALIPLKTPATTPSGVE